MTNTASLLDFAANDTPCSTPVVTRIYLTLGKFDRRVGQRYNAHLGSPDGEQIVTDALDVEYAACRALKQRGVGGWTETWWIGAASPSALIADIEEAAQWTLRESATRSLSVTRYRPLPHALRGLGARETSPFQIAGDAAQAPPARSA
jgi:hypothetical protein